MRLSIWYQGLMAWASAVQSSRAGGVASPDLLCLKKPLGLGKGVNVSPKEYFRIQLQIVLWIFEQEDEIKDKCDSSRYYAKISR